MEVVLDLMKMTKKLKGTKKVEQIEMTSGVSYLYCQIFGTIINGGYVQIGDIDFNAFDESELDDFIEMYNGNINKQLDKTHEIANTFSNVEPRIKFEKAFF